jgi:hypothetical protein
LPLSLESLNSTKKSLIALDANKVSEMAQHNDQTGKIDARIPFNEPRRLRLVTSDA